MALYLLVAQLCRVQCNIPVTFQALVLEGVGFKMDQALQEMNFSWSSRHIALGSKPRSRQNGIYRSLDDKCEHGPRWWKATAYLILLILDFDWYSRCELYSYGSVGFGPSGILIRVTNEDY